MPSDPKLEEAVERLWKWVRLTSRLTPEEVQRIFDVSAVLQALAEAQREARVLERIHAYYTLERVAAEQNGEDDHEASSVLRVIAEARSEESKS